MGIGYVLYNSKAGTKNSLEDIKLLEVIIDAELKFIDILNIRDYRVFLTGLEPDDFLILAGGDGTLNRFVNNTEGIDFQNEILYFPNGTGNDFAHELGHSKECNPFPITEYLKDLPCVVVKGKKYRFINGVGYGIDGYCCEVGDELKKIPGKKVNYTSIAIKGLLFHYKPTNAKVTVDGKTRTYKKVWLAPTMNGKYYGGGMMPTPKQERNSGKLSTPVFHDSGKLRTLMIFPSIFKGEHVKHTKFVDILEGHEITTMPKVISDLWYGNLNPCDRTLKKGSRMAELVAQIAETQEDLFAKLNDEEKALFEQFDDCTNEMYGLSERDAFVSGFTLGARIIIEVMRSEIDE